MLKFPFQFIAEWMCFLTSILLLRRSDQYWRTLRYYLCYVIIVESVSYYLAYKYHNNLIFCNLTLIFEYSYGLWLISNLVNLKNIKLVCLIAYLAFCVSYGLEYKSHRLGLYYFNNADTFGSVIMIGLCLVYYFSLFQDEEYVDILKEPLFWFISGYFIFYTTSISLDTFFQKLVEVRIAHSISLRNIIMKILNFIFYGCWIKSFLCLRNKRRFIQQL